MRNGAIRIRRVLSWVAFPSETGRIYSELPDVLPRVFFASCAAPHQEASFRPLSSGRAFPDRHGRVGVHFGDGAHRKLYY